MAKRASERMSSDSDTDFKNVLEGIMKTDPGSEDERFVKDILDQIAALAATDDLKGSDIRVFCDDDRRWEKTVIEEKSERKVHWLDQTNKMVRDTKPACLETNANDKKKTLGVSVRVKMHDSDGHNDNRIVVTICDLAFDKPKNKGCPARLDDPEYEEQFKDLTDTRIEYLSATISTTVLHELAHAVSVNNGQFTVKDVPKNRAYGWNNVFKKPGHDAVKNADNYVYLGLWASLADMGYTFYRLTGDKDVDADFEDAIEEGTLKKYSDITKRSLLMIAKWFVA